MNYADIHERLAASLGLERVPIAVAFADTIPDGVEPFDGVAAAGCQFWEKAAAGPIATSTPDHELCAVGVHTHRMAEPSQQCQEELGETLAVLEDLTYVRASDVARIPVMPRPSEHVVYAPLARSPLPPDVVLLFADARRSLVITEAVDQLEEGAPPALGRPACAAVPASLNSGRAALSLGCCGARAYIDAMPDDVAMWAIPGDNLEAYAERISALAEANAVLTKFHATRRQDVEAGTRPSFQDSLAKIG